MRKYATQTILLCVVIVLAALSLGAIVANTYAHRGDSRTIRHVDNNGTLSIDQARRTECRSKRQSALNSAQMAIIFGILGSKNATADEIAAAGQQGGALPDIDTLVTRGGAVPVIRKGVVVRTLHFAACPPSIINRKAS